MKKVSLLLGIVTFCALAFVPTQSARADNLYGTIRGVIKDQSGAVVPNARVTIQDANTGVTRQYTTGTNGSFEFLNLQAPATYSLRVEKSGFQVYASRGIHLNLNQNFVISPVLAVGATTEEVTVQANVAQIDTTSMQRGTTISGRQIVDLPLDGRDWLQLQQLQPGVVASSDRWSDAYSTNGAETQQNSFYVNGVDTGDISINNRGIIPSLDAIAEFRMITSTINAEYGRNSGAIMNAVIRSGTNQLHGDGFDFYRDISLDARNFFQADRSPYHRNQFGGTIGGPVWIPHIYNGRNKTFFFFSYAGERSGVPQPFSLPTVFTQAQRGGAWPGLATSAGTSGFSLTGDNGTVYPAGTPYSTIFSNGTIPTADLNPLALKLMNQFVPQPNAPANQYTFDPITTTLDDQTIVRMDQNIGTKDAIWGYWLWEREPTTETLPFIGATLPGFGETDALHNWELAANWNHIFSPTTVNDARFGYYRQNFFAVSPTNPINPATYGFTGINPQTLSGASLPVMNLTGFFSLGFSSDGPQPRIENTYQFSDNLSKILGRHTLKFGFTMERFELDNPFFNNLSGTYTFNGTGVFSTGLPGADFLLGVPDSYIQGSGGVNNTRAQEYYSYAQDEFKLRPNLTLIYGLGWDIETPFVNLYANGEAVAAFRPGEQSKVFPTAPPGLLYPGDPGITNTGGPTTPYRDFAPRVGFAWSPGSPQKWSLRGGFGLYYNRTEGELALQNLGVPPTAQTSFGVGDVLGVPSLAAPFTGWCPSAAAGAAPVSCSEPNKFPFTPPAVGSKIDFSQFEPLSLNVVSPNFGVPMSENYSLTIERQINPSTVASIAYVGNVGRHLEGAQELNPAGVAPGLNPIALANGCLPTNLISCAPSSFPYTPSTFASLGQQSTDYNSNYNSLQASVNKEFSHGLQFVASYTWSRYFDYTSSLENSAFNDPGIDPFNWHNMYGPSANDAPQRFVFQYDYTLPIYHFVHRFRKLTDGWRLTGITTFQSGFPIGLYDSADPSLTCNAAPVSYYACPDRPNRVSGVPLNIGNPRTYAISGQPNYYFNPAAFAMPGPGTGIGSASRNPLHGPGLNDFDVGFFKDIHISESKYVELRLQAYNVFNHVQFTGSGVNNSGGVVADINNPEFGRVVSANDPRILELGGKIYF